MNVETNIVLAGGCFWGVEHYLSLIPGVLRTEVGYANGNTENPSYEMVCTGNTGFAEAVSVTYDSSRIELSELLTLFFKVIDPSSTNRQGNDVGTQYRTGIYYTNVDDLAIINGSLTCLGESLNRPVLVEAGPLKNFYLAEKYHQKYLTNNPRGYCHIPNACFEMVRQRQNFRQALGF